jgi:mono/diheme cytochrome c family protein
MDHHRPIAGLALAVAFASKALAADPDVGDAAEGKRLALQTCTACHRVSPDQPDPPKLQPPAPSFVSVANGAALSAPDLREFLMSRHRSAKTPPNMPTMILTEREASDLTAYIASLRKAP